MNLKRLLLLALLVDNTMVVHLTVDHVADLMWLLKHGYIEEDEWSGTFSVSEKGKQTTDAAVVAAL